MKKLLFVLAAVLFTVSVASAKGGFGVTAGLNFNSTKIQDIKTDARAGFNVGLTYQVKLPLGFSLQPSLLYTQKNGAMSFSGNGLLDKLMSETMVQSVGSLVVPISAQWGPDLIVARPFLDVTPYVGYALSNKLKSTDKDVSSVLEGEKSLDYGVGLGAGVNVWKLQAIVRYNWSFGTMGSLADFAGLDLKDMKDANRVYGGISINIAYLF